MILPSNPSWCPHNLLHVQAWTFICVEQRQRMKTSGALAMRKTSLREEYSWEKRSPGLMQLLGVPMERGCVMILEEGDRTSSGA